MITSFISVQPTIFYGTKSSPLCPSLHGRNNSVTTIKSGCCTFVSHPVYSSRKTTLTRNPPIIFRKARRSEASQIVELMREQENIMHRSIQEVISWIENEDVSVASIEENGNITILGVIRVFLLVDIKNRENALDEFHLTKLFEEKTLREVEPSHALENARTSELERIGSLNMHQMLLVLVGALVCKRGTDATDLCGLLRYASIVDLSRRIKELKETNNFVDIRNARQLGFIFGTTPAETRIPQLASRILRKLVRRTWLRTEEGVKRNQWHYCREMMRPDGISAQAHLILSDI